MPPLLTRLRAAHAHPQPRPAARRHHRHLRHDWFYWSCVALVLIAVVSVFFWSTSARILQEPLRIDYGPTDPAFTTALGPVVGA
jgi:hypothetical protein